MGNVPHNDLLQWWKKASQRKNLSVQEFGEVVIPYLVALQEHHQAQEEKSFQRGQKLFSRIERWQARTKTLEERVEIQIEMEVEEQKIVFSGQVDRALKAQQRVFLETIDKMLQSYQDALRAPKGGDTLPKK